MYYWSFWGMNVFWWLFWLLLIIGFFAWAVPVPRSRARQYDDPLAILRRRYAAGEITTDEYEERRVRLERDQRTQAPPLSGPPSQRHVEQH